MLELASWGASVIHTAPSSSAPSTRCPSTSPPASATHRAPSSTEAPYGKTNNVSGIAHDTDVARITIRGVPDQPGIAATIFEPLGQHRLSVDTIVQNASVEHLTDLTFTSLRSDLDRAMCPSVRSPTHIQADEVVAETHLAKVSIVGTGITSGIGYAGRMFRALFDAGINIELITTSEIRITCLIDESRVADAVKALHKAFELEQAA